MSWPAQGIHHGVPFATYRSCDINQSDTIETVAGKSVSKSLIIDFIPDPFAWKQSPPKKQTAAMKGGSLFDCLLTEPEEFENRYTLSLFAEFRTDESKAWKKSMEARGISVIKQDELDKACEQIAAVMANPEAAKLINGSQKQVAFRHETKHPFWSKGLVDVFPEDESCLADIKIIRSSAFESRRAMQRYMLEFGFHIQAGNYCDGWSFVTGKDMTSFKFIAVSESKPFISAVIPLPFSAIIFGADAYRAGMARFAQCLERDEWPSIWDGEVELDLPQYAYSEGGDQ